MACTAAKTGEDAFRCSDFADRLQLSSNFGERHGFCAGSSVTGGGNFKPVRQRCRHLQSQQQRRALLRLTPGLILLASWAALSGEFYSSVCRRAWRWSAPFLGWRGRPRAGVPENGMS